MVNFAFLVAISLISSILVYLTLIQFNFNQHLNMQNRKLSYADQMINRELGDMKKIIQLLHGNDQIRKSLSFENGRIDTLKIEDIFKQFSRSVDSFLQFRWLDETGMEHVRLEKITPANEKPIWVNSKNLQDKSHRYYFKDAMLVEAPDVYFSKIDLNVENSKVVEPYQPTVRAAIKTSIKDGMRPGVLIINFDLSRLLKNIHKINDNSGIDFYITDSEGYWIINPDLSKEWGKSLNNTADNMAITNPDDWNFIAAKKSASTTNNYPQETSFVSRIFGFSRDKKIIFRTLNLNNGSLGNTQSSIFLISEISKNLLATMRYQAFMAALATGVLLLLGGILLLHWDHRLRLRMIELHEKLNLEKERLDKSNEDLSTALRQQVLLQEDLVEARKLSSLGMMVAGVAHELNTPIGGALMATSSVKNQQEALKASLNTGLTKTQLHEYIEYSDEGLKNIRHHLSKAADLVKRFKRLAIESSHEGVVEFTLAVAIKDVLLSLRSKLDAADIQVNVNLDNDIIMHGLPGTLTQVLQNLILNAITHGLQDVTHPLIEIRAHRYTSETIELAVIDNGCGIHPDLKQTLFDPFVTTNRGAGNTGLGLHFVHQWITKQLHGTVHYQTSQTGGGCFVIHIPMCLQDTPTSL